MKDGTLATEIDKIHGLDPAEHKKRDTRFARFEVSLAPELPKSLGAVKTVESVENRLLELEMAERARSIDMKACMTELTQFQLEYYKRLEQMEKKLDEALVGLAAKCDKLEKVVQRYKT
jgi:hypothetical protein